MIVERNNQGIQFYKNIDFGTPEGSSIVLSGTRNPGFASFRSANPLCEAPRRLELLPANLFGLFSLYFLA